jgi:iron-sulfur cluster repair protein YtfE (RIC family)
MAQVPVGTPAHRVAEEHRVLRQLLAEIKSASAHPSGGPDAVAAHLETLREFLSEHFEEEESSGFFEQIEELTPEKAHECEALCAEHEGLLQRLDELREVGPEARREAAWGTGVNALLHALSSHENRENELLTRALDGSDQAQD